MDSQLKLSKVEHGSLYSHRYELESQPGQLGGGVGGHGGGGFRLSAVTNLHQSGASACAFVFSSGIASINLAPLLALSVLFGKYTFSYQ